MKTTVFIATSLDGFIARRDGGIDWLSSPDPQPEPEDHGYDAMFASVDALVMGRNTYDLVGTFPSWPYGDKPVIVLTSRPFAEDDRHRGRVEAMSGSPREILDRLGGRGMEQLYVDGGRVVQSFLREGLIDRMIITRIPVLIGAGIPLFGPLPSDVRLRHVATRVFPSGLVQSEYEPRRL